MDRKGSSLTLLLNQKILPLYYHESAATSIRILQALYDAGIRILEYTHRGESAVENFLKLKEHASLHMSDLQLGIGTIKTVAQAKEYIRSGADFIVCPSINREVGEVCQDAGLLWVPGCMTPTEIAVAEETGAGLVKIFPGSLLGPSYIAAIRELFPGLLFMPTGGVDLGEDNLRAWFASGVCAVGMGSKLISKTLIEKQAFDTIRTLTVEALKTIQELTVNGQW